MMDVPSDAADQVRAVTAEVSSPSSNAQQSSNNTETPEHPTVHANIEKDEGEVVLAGSSTRQNPDVRTLVRQMHVFSTRLESSIEILFNIITGRIINTLALVQDFVAGFQSGNILEIVDLVMYMKFWRSMPD